jgi:hypothetical protein
VTDPWSRFLNPQRKEDPTVPDRDYRPRDLELPKMPKTPTAFKVWFVFCALLGLSLVGLIVWAVIALVTHYT